MDNLSWLWLSVSLFTACNINHLLCCVNSCLAYTHCNIYLAIKIITLHTTHYTVHCSQITDSDLCNKIQKLFESGKEVRLMVSPRIVSYTDYKLSQVSSSDNDVP